MFEVLATNQADFTQFFRRLADAIAPGTGEDAIRELFVDPAAADMFLGKWRARLATEPLSVMDRREAMRRINPAYIPRNHRIEEIIRAAVDEGNFAPFERLLTILSRPFDDQPEFAPYRDSPLEHQRVQATFCGT
jgi:uncharacterized protein YdiU (UPF0061 family)